MRLRRFWVFVLFLYIAIDFTDPGMPGAFFFESDNLFVDGVINTSASHFSDDSVLRPAPESTVPRIHTTEVPAHAAVLATVVDRNMALRSTLRSHTKTRYDARSTSSFAEDH